MQNMKSGLFSEFNKFKMTDIFPFDTRMTQKGSKALILRCREISKR